MIRELLRHPAGSGYFSDPMRPKPPYRNSPAEIPSRSPSLARKTDRIGFGPHHACDRAISRPYTAESRPHIAVPTAANNPALPNICLEFDRCAAATAATAFMLAQKFAERK
jgi:hypothetical protein